MRRRSFGFSLVLCLLARFVVPSGVTAGEGPGRDPEILSFRDLARASSTERFSERVRRLRGQRVRIVGYMAHAEQPPNGIFYLCSVPVSLDEGGAGTGDLPPESIRVSVPALAGRPLPSVPRPLEVTGVLDLGYREEDDGQVSWIRLNLETPPTATPEVPKP